MRRQRPAVAGPHPALRARRALRALVPFVVALGTLSLGTVAGTGTAQAATATAPAGAHSARSAASGYRYWSFWEQKESGDWSYATQGPAVLRPSDGDVLGFRFAVSEDSKDASQPRGPAGFDDACARTEKKSGTKRVALRIDFGTSADAPEGGSEPPKPRTGCARLDEDGTAADALASVAKPLRYNSDSLLCAIAGYPDKGCGEQVSGKEKAKGDGQDGAQAKDGGSGESGGMSTGLGFAAGAAAVVVLGGAAYWQARRRRE